VEVGPWTPRTTRVLEGLSDDRLDDTAKRRRGDVATVRLREMDERTTYMQQLQEDTAPVVLINQFNVAPEDVERFLEAWADDAAFMKRQPGFISTQLHRGTAGSTTFMNVAVWESSRALGEAFGSPEFQERAARYPDSAVAAPHVFQRIAVPGICVA
jgi:heme-degrading monooxygenase HmoA